MSIYVSHIGIYYPPMNKTLASLKTYIESLPIIDEPEIFGLHENANIAFQMNETHALIGNLNVIIGSLSIVVYSTNDMESSAQEFNDIIFLNNSK